MRGEAYFTASKTSMAGNFYDDPAVIAWEGELTFLSLSNHVVTVPSGATAADLEAFADLMGKPRAEIKSLAVTAKRNLDGEPASTAISFVDRYRLGVGLRRRVAPTDELGVDYGEPLSTCSETAPGLEIFTRKWSKATVTLNCKTWEGNITMV